MKRSGPGDLDAGHRRSILPSLQPLLLVVVLLALSGCETLGLDEIFSDEEADVPAAAAIGTLAYDVEIRGLPEGSDIQTVAEGVLRTYQLQERKAASLAALRRRADDDIEDFTRIMHAEGYYDATIETEVTEPVGEDGKALAIFHVTPNQRYAVGELTLRFVEDDPRLPPIDDLRRTAALPSGAPARGDAIVDAEARVTRYLTNHGFPYARFVRREARAREAAARIDVTSFFDAGPYATFGETRIEGSENVELDYLRELIPWQQGDPASRAELNRLQQRLTSSGLFQSVTVKLPERGQPAAGDDNARPVTVTLQEAKPRSIRGGIRFDTDRGPGVRAGWRHRNLFGRAEDLQTTADLTLDEQIVSAELDRPRYPSERWTAVHRLELRNSKDDAFDVRSITGQVGLRTALEGGWTVGGGIEPSAAVTETDTRSDTAYLVGFPFFARRDRSDDPLNPTQGHRLNFGVDPNVGLNNGSPVWFTVVSSGGSYYLPVIGEDRLVLASRGRVASILSEDIDDVPVNELFFAGGGASVRGFGFRSISPVANDDETGGRFLTEGSIEARVKITQDIGVVAFVDGAVVEEEPFPAFQERLNIGYGAGLRYYTPIGPLRLDVGLPLNPRDGDSAFEVYISLGQSF